MRSNRVSRLWLFWAVFLISSMVRAQEAQVVLQEPEIEPPAHYTERKIDEFRKRLAELKGQRGELEVESFDAATTLNSLLEELTASRKTLELTVDADSTFFDSPVGPVQIEGVGALAETDQVFITLVSQLLETPFGSTNLVAADEATSVAFNLPYALSSNFFSSATILRPRKEKVCLKRSTEDTPANTLAPCLKEVEAFDELKTPLDPRLVLDQIDGTISFDGFSGEVDASNIHATKAGDVSVVFEYADGVELTFQSNEAGSRSFITGAKAGPKKEIVASTEAVKFVGFGLPNIDLDQPGAEMPRLDYFMGVIEDDPYGELVMGDAARSDIPKPIAAYRDGSGIKYDGLVAFRLRSKSVYKANVVVNARLKNFGPLDDTLRIPDHALPGTSEVEWTLNGAFAVNHSFTLTNVSVSIEGPKDLEHGSVELFADRDYLFKIVLDGPLGLDKFKEYDLVWDEDIDWLDNEDIEALDNQIVITRQFSIKPDATSKTLVSLKQGEDEIFAYESNFILKPATVSGMTHTLERVLPTTGETVTLPENTSIDTFFPSADPKASSRFSVTLNFIDHKGNEINSDSINQDLIDAHTHAQLTGNPNNIDSIKKSQSLPNTMLAPANNDYAIRIQRNNEKAEGRFLVLPKIGATQITSKLTPVSSGSMLRTLTGAEDLLEAEPVTVTSNAMRLLRNDNGYQLIVNGPADMSQYEAIWTVVNGGGPKTGFKRQDEAGFAAEFRTGNNLEQVEIVLKSDPTITVARMLGLQSTLPPEILILPFRTVATEVSESALEFADANTQNAIEDQCVDALQPQAGARSAKTQCANQRDEREQQIDERRDAQKSLNKFIDNLEDNDQRLVELVDEMEVAASVKGAPDEVLGEAVCVWSIVDGSAALQLNERVTRLQRDPSLGDFCFNLVSNIKEGFSPGAELRVELQIL